MHVLSVPPRKTQVRLPEHTVSYDNGGGNDHGFPVRSTPHPHLGQREGNNISAKGSSERLHEGHGPERRFSTS